MKINSRKINKSEQLRIRIKRVTKKNSKKIRRNIIIKKQKLRAGMRIQKIDWFKRKNIGRM